MLWDVERVDLIKKVKGLEGVSHTNTGEERILDRGISWWKGTNFQTRLDCSRHSEEKSMSGKEWAWRISRTWSRKARCNKPWSLLVYYKKFVFNYIKEEVFNKRVISTVSSLKVDSRWQEKDWRDQFRGYLSNLIKRWWLPGTTVKVMSSHMLAL